MAKGQTNAGSPIIEVDSELDLYSTNPVQNNVVTEALMDKQGLLTAGPGININTNNEISVIDNNKFLKNSASADYAYAIGGTATKNYGTAYGYSANATGTDGAIAIGRMAISSGSGSIAIGSGLLNKTTANANNSIAIGDQAQATNTSAIAIGTSANATAQNAVQIGSGTNSETGTLKFRNYPLVDNSGKIVDDRISSNIARISDIPPAVTVDQEFDPYSENAQSGIAISNEMANSGFIRNDSISPDVGLAILGTDNCSGNNQNIVIGNGASINGSNAMIAIGAYASASEGGIVIGEGSSVLGHWNIAIGNNAHSEGGIQIGCGTATENSLWIGGLGHYSHNYKLLDSDGIIPDARLSNNIARLENIPPAVTVDQIYNSSSANPQSGVAVASAISGFIRNTSSTYGNIGITGTVSGSFNIAIGIDSEIGESTSRNLALGAGAKVRNANNSIQLGGGTNTESNTIYAGAVGGNNHKLFDLSTGLIPDERLSNNIARVSDIPSLTDYLQNTATGSNSLDILGNSFGFSNAITIGYDARMIDTVAGDNSVAIGCSTLVGANSVALGYKAEVRALQAYQIGEGINYQPYSLSIGFGSLGNYELLDGNTGLIPDDRLSSNIARTSSLPTVDQTYNASSTNAQSGAAIAGAGFLTNKGTLSYNLAIGEDATAENAYSTALGAFSHATAQSAIQLGMGTNSTAHTFQVWNYELLDVNGLIPDNRLSSNIVRTSVLSDYLLSSTAASTYATKQEVSQIPQFDIQVVNSLPVSDISETTVYLLRNSESSGSDLYEEYIYVNNTWELLGTASIDLTGYLQNEATGTDSLSIGSATGTDYSTAYGIGIELGSNTGQAAFGVYAKAFGGNALALGSEAVANAFGAIQIGKGTNNEASSLYIGLNEPYQRHNYKLLDGTTGLIPADRLTVMTGANGTNAGAKGAVPAPTATDNTKFLRGDGTWAEAGVVVDNSTINKNASNELQAIAILNKNSSAGATNPLNLWEGTSLAWTNGEATPWYYWETDITGMWKNGTNLPDYQSWDNACRSEDTIIVLAANGAKFLYSADYGETWNQTTSTIPNASWYFCAYGNGVFVAIPYSNYNGTIRSTDNGRTWQAGGSLPSGGTWAGVAYGDNTFVITASGSDETLRSTDGGVTWTAGGNLPSSDGGTWGIVYGNGIFIARLYNSNKTAYSTDGGVTWTAGGNLPATGNWRLAYGNETFVGVTRGSNKTAYSTDGGVTWTAGGNLPATGNWEFLTYGNGVFISVGSYSSNSIYSTDNGRTWQSANLPTNTSWRSIVYGDNNFIAIVQHGTTTSIFEFSYDKCYTLDQTPTTESIIYKEPEVFSAKTITSVGSGTITLSDSLTYNYTPGGNQNTYRTIGDAHPDWLCNIEGVGVKIGNTLIAEKNSGSTVTIDSSITASSTNANAAGSKAVWDLVSALETRVAALESQLSDVESQLANI